MALIFHVIVMFLLADLRKSFSIRNTLSMVPSIISYSGLKCAISSVPDTVNFWSEGLKFGCTGCGKCCQTEGEVWFDTEEFSALVDHLRLPARDVLNIYVEKAVSGWAKIKEKKIAAQSSGQTQETDGCIFLDNDGKRCTIYNVRPQQCRTYPYWPRLLAVEKNWLDEALLPEDSPLRTVESKKWTPEHGGCEGINHPDAKLISSNAINIGLSTYTKYNAGFSSLEVGDDETRLIQRSGIIKAVNNAMKEWATSFAPQYGLLQQKSINEPFTYNFRTFLGSDRRAVSNRIGLEAFSLLSRRGTESNPAVFLSFPFAFPNYADFKDFSSHLTSTLIPELEKEINFEATLEEKADNFIEYILFHPAFKNPSLDDRDPRHFLSRSPFPAVCLSLHRQVDTRKDHKQLASVPYSKVLDEFNSILMKAVQ